MPHHCPEEGMHGNMTSWVVYNFQRLSLAVWHCCFCPHLHSLSIMKVYICSIPSSLPSSPADRHMFIQGLPAGIRQAERCMENPPKDLHSPPLGKHLGCLWTFPQYTYTQAVESVMSQSLSAPHSTGANLRRLCCPNSYSAGSAQRARCCFTISIPEADLFGVRNLFKVLKGNPRVFLHHHTSFFAPVKVSSQHTYYV